MQSVASVVKEEASILSTTVSAAGAESTILSTRTIVSAVPLRASAVDALSGGSKGEVNKMLSDLTPHSPASLAAEIDASLSSMRQSASNAVQAGLEDSLDQINGTGAVTEEVKSLLTEFHA